MDWLAEKLVNIQFSHLFIKCTIIILFHSLRIFTLSKIFKFLLNNSYLLFLSIKNICLIILAEPASYNRNQQKKSFRFIPIFSNYFLIAFNLLNRQKLIRYFVKIINFNKLNISQQQF